MIFSINQFIEQAFLSMKLKTIQKLFDLWTYRLGLKWWEINIHYIEDPQTIIDTFRITDNEIVVAKTFADWKYMTANIYVNLPSIITMHKYTVERIIVHELVHVLVNEMRENDINHEERVVTSLTKAVFWIEQDVKYPAQEKGK